MSIEKEYGKSKTYYPKGIITKDDNFNREEWRKKMIDDIVRRTPSEFLVLFPAIIEQAENGSLVWNRAKLELEDDVALTFKSNICRNTPE